MKILLTNQVMGDNTGTDTCTRTIAKYLVRARHNVYLWAPHYVGSLEFHKATGAVFVPNLEHLARLPLDIGHIHHTPCLMTVRKLRPDLPLLFLSHGVIPPEEVPPAGRCNLGRVLCVSWEVIGWLEQMGIQKKLLHQWSYPIDPDIFQADDPPPLATEASTGAQRAHQT
ncbi:unnamed protein product, partial [marine sediment metagenome]